MIQASALDHRLASFDVNRVEVLEGPQGTLFGSGSLGGSIRLITNKPDLSHFKAETEDTISGIQGGGLNYDANLMVDVPLVEDKLALRAVGYYERSGGYVDNIAGNETNVNHALSKGGHLEPKWVPTPKLNLLATALIENDIPHDSAYSFYDSKKYEWDGLIATPAFNKTRICSLSANYDLNWATLTSITTYADRYENIISDFVQSRSSCLGSTPLLHCMTKAFRERFRRKYGSAPFQTLLSPSRYVSAHAPSG